MTSKSVVRSALIGAGLVVGGYVVGQLEAESPGVVEEKFRNATKTGEGLGGAAADPVRKGVAGAGNVAANTAEGAPAPAGQ